MEHLEGRHSVLAALRAYQRRFQVILLRQDCHRDKLVDLIELAAQRGVPIRYAAAAELDALDAASPRQDGPTYGAPPHVAAKPSCSLTGQTCPPAATPGLCPQCAVRI
jgi:tRNA G18 (ribose-2'-O)-methylase SpoU